MAEAALKTRTFLIWRVDKDYGLPKYYYIEDSWMHSYGYAPGLATAVLNYIKHIPHSFSIRRLNREVTRMSQAEQRRQAK